VQGELYEQKDFNRSRVRLLLKLYVPIWWGVMARYFLKRTPLKNPEGQGRASRQFACVRETQLPHTHISTGVNLTFSKWWPHPPKRRATLHVVDGRGPRLHRWEAKGQGLHSQTPKRANRGTYCSDSLRGIPPGAVHVKTEPVTTRGAREQAN